MSEDKGMTVQQLYDHIVKQITPEVALMRLLEGSLIQYEKLKFDSQKGAVHPIIVISMATMDMGWDFAIEPNEVNIRGMVIGTKEYMETIFPPKPL